MWWASGDDSGSNDLTLGQKIDMGRIRRRQLLSPTSVNRVFRGVLSLLLLVAVSCVVLQYWSNPPLSQKERESFHGETSLQAISLTSTRQHDGLSAFWGKRQEVKIAIAPFVQESSSSLVPSSQQSEKEDGPPQVTADVEEERETPVTLAAKKPFGKERNREKEEKALSLSYAEAEKIFRNIPSASRSYEHLAVLTSLPHIAGTPEDYETAKFVQRSFESFGLESHMTVHTVLMSYPLNSSIELLSPHKYTAHNQERFLPEDLTSGDDRSYTTKPYNCYSGNGDVTAELVYANYGLEEDFSLLEQLGVNVSGKIVIFRYGATFRGNKAWQAQRRGAAGVLIYSDPLDDGYSRGKVYPEGPWRPDHSVQRGGVGFPSICEGSPDESRLGVCGVNSVYDLRPKIPVHPLAYRDAEPLLRALGGKEAPKNFQGGLNFTYHIGPGPATVRLFVHNEFKMTSIWNVFATIKGRGERGEEPEERKKDELEERDTVKEEDKLVILGNHRDAWTFGAVDPNSGTAALLEIGRGLGELLKKGWRPRRTIMLANWDGEEPNLLGSTAWVEAHRQELSKKTVAYLNVDCGVSGPYYFTSATPQLHSLVRNVSLATSDPGEEGGSVWKPWMDKEYPGVLGGGSDFEGFLNHIGIPAVDMGFSFLPEGGYPVYHSNFDSISWMTKFGDPTYKFFPAVAQIWGVLGLKLAQEELLPFNYSHYGAQLQTGLERLQKLMEAHPKASELNLQNLQKSISDFNESAASINSEIIAFERRFQHFAHLHKLTEEDVQEREKLAKSLNHRLMYAERAFIVPEGLPGRKWYKHVVVDNAKTLGYGYDLFPGVAQAIRDEERETAQKQLEIAVTCVQKAAAVLRGEKSRV